jgi:GntR family transcriptional repressor for pyruvate dehydrogenase complex
VSATQRRDRTTARVRTPVFAAIAARVLELAVTEGLSSGDRLPSERELARRIGVSRASLREALTALRIAGAIEVQHGNGIYLLHAPTDTVEPIAIELARAHPGLPALGEVRNTLEAQAAELAALRREDADLLAMTEAVDAMAAAVDDGEPATEGDRRFHAAILIAARNPVLSDLLSYLAEGAAQIAAASLARGGQPARSLAAHRLILEAISEHDCEQARRLMREHLELTGQMRADT